MNSGLPAADCGPTDDAVLVNALRAIRASAGSGAAGIVMVRRDKPCTARYNADDTFSMMSEVKLLMAIYALHESQDESTVTTVEHMIKYSDDRDADELWKRYGGAEIIDYATSTIGLASLSAPADLSQWGSTRINALDMARIWQWILDSAPSVVRQPILEGAGNAAEYGNSYDGEPRTDQYFGIPDAFPDQTFWIKQGWGSSAGRRVVNTTGILGTGKEIVLVIMSSYTLSVTEVQGEQAVTAGAKAITPVAHP